MTRDEINALSGRELDAAVAERVLGKTVVWVAAAPGAPIGPRVEFLDSNSETLTTPLAYYSRDWGMVFDVAEAMQRRWRKAGREWYWSHVEWPDGTWEANVRKIVGQYGFVVISASAPALPEAICKAALLALEAEGDDEQSAT